MAYVENVAHAHLLACDALTPDSAVNGQAYFINEPEPVNLWHWVNELLTRAGLPPVKKKISSNLAWGLGACLEGLFTLGGISAEPPMTRFVALQLSQSHSYSIDKARNDFGYSPLVSVADGMKKLEPELLRLAHG
jgi:nucleoside-diphosphate-sugar epimerase